LPLPEPATQPAATVDDLAWDRVFAEPPQKRPRTARAVAQVRWRCEQDAQTQRRVNEIAGSAKGGDEHSAQQRLDGVRSIAQPCAGASLCQTLNQWCPCMLI